MPMPLPLLLRYMIRSDTPSVIAEAERLAEEAAAVAAAAGGSPTSAAGLASAAAQATAAELAAVAGPLPAGPAPEPALPPLAAAGPDGDSLPQLPAGPGLMGGPRRERKDIEAGTDELEPEEEGPPRAGGWAVPLMDRVEVSPAGLALIEQIVTAVNTSRCNLLPSPPNP